MHCLIKTLLMIILFSSTAFANDKPAEISRRGFLGFLGAGAAAAVLPLPSIAATAQIPIRIGQVEYLKALRKALRERGLLGGIGPKPPFGLANESIWSYERKLVEALNNKNISAQERSIIENLSSELRASYPNAHYRPSNSTESAKSRSNSDSAETAYQVEILPDLITLRYTLTRALLTRIAWQLAYPEENILPKNSSLQDFELLREYRSELTAYFKAFEDSSITLPRESRFFLDHWLETVNDVFELSHVQEWANEKDAELSSPKFCKGFL